MLTNSFSSAGTYEFKVISELPNTYSKEYIFTVTLYNCYAANVIKNPIEPNWYRIGSG